LGGTGYGPAALATRHSQRSVAEGRTAGTCQELILASSGALPRRGCAMRQGTSTRWVLLFGVKLFLLIYILSRLTGRVAEMFRMVRRLVGL
jgi:hypothetical protein